MIEVTLTMPARMRLRINGEKLSRNVGNRLATHVRRQWLRGQTGGGESIPVSDDADANRRPLHRTGELARAVRYSRQYQMVMASNLKRTHGQRSLSRRAWSLYGLSRILISGKWRRGRDKGRPVRPVVDLYGDQSTLIAAKKQEAAQREVTRQLRANELGLVTELEHIYRSGRRSRR